MNFTEMSHIKVAEALGGRKLRFAVDATLGRGRDALFAMSLLGGGGELFGFDVQARAIEESRRLFESKGVAVSTEDFPVDGARAKFFRASHADMETLLPERARGKIGAAFFNLGWLPASDKSVVTSAAETVAALEALARVCDPAGCIVSVLCYRGHAGGEEEFCAVRDFFARGGFGYEMSADWPNPLSPVLVFAKLNFA